MRLIHGLVVVALPSLVGPAAGEILTVTLDGTVTSVSDGSGGNLDLRPWFSPGQTLQVSYKVDTGVPGSDYNGGLIYNHSLIGSLQFESPGYTCSVTPAGFGYTVIDDATVDSYSVQAIDFGTSCLAGSAYPWLFSLQLEDQQASTLQADVHPTEISPSEFETNVWILMFNNGWGSYGLITGTLTSGTVPVDPVSWGAIKTLYR